MKKVKNILGFSLLEMLVVLAVFSLLAIVSTSALLLAIRGAKKSDATARVRENVDFAVATMERQIRNASSIESCASDKIVFDDPDFASTFFSCVNIGMDDAYVASGSARLSAQEVIVTECSFSCLTDSSGNINEVDIFLSAIDRNSQGAESSGFKTNTKVILRTY